MDSISFELNGKEVTVTCPGTRRLLDVLREDFGLTAAKEGCGEGECGACSVLKDGRVINSCMVPVGSIRGCVVTTVEGLRDTPQGRRIIDAFVESGSVQCGFCTPGMVMAAASLLSEHPHPSEAEIREGLSGNLCRCTGYDALVRGVMLASEEGDGLW